jgi:hypothetical protein
LRTKDDKDVSTLKKEEEEAKAEVKRLNEVDEDKKELETDKKVRETISKGITKRKAENEQREKINAVKIHWPFSQ